MNGDILTALMVVVAVGLATGIVWDIWQGWRRRK